MKRTLSALATAAVLSVAALQANAQATNNEMQMVEDTVIRLLIDLNIPSDNIKSLTLDQARRILTIAESKEMGDGVRAQVMSIINE